MLYNALNHAKARALPEGKHSDGQGLWLIKRNQLFGKWILRITIHGRRREMGLGRWPDVSIAEARERASDARKTVRDGIDPIVKRARERAASRKLTVKEAIEGCFEARQAELKRNGEAGRWLSPLNVHVLPRIGRYPIEDIDQHILKETLGPIWHQKPQAAVKALNRIGLALKHAAALGLDVDLQATMKARELLGKQRHKVTHHPSMDYNKAPAFYQWLTTVPGVAALGLRFLILTVARTSEVRLARFSEFEDGVWTLSPDRTKAGTEHRVPLSNGAKRILLEARSLTESEYLFPSYRGKPMSDAAMSVFMRREGYEARPHGFRATFRTWAEEVANADHEVKEGCLGHSVDNHVVRAYQRSDRLEKRADLLAQWDSYITAGQN